MVGDCMDKVSFEELVEKMNAYTRTKEGLRNSSKREQILRVLYDKGTHLSPDEVYREVRENIDSKIGISTVYRTLALFDEAGLVNQISLGNDSMSYEINCGEHHDHLICKKCGEIVEFYDEALEEMQDKIAVKHGYKLENHEMRLIGVCPKCREKS